MCLGFRVSLLVVVVSLVVVVVVVVVVVIVIIVATHKPCTNQRLVDQRLVDQRLVDQRLVRNVRGPTCNQTGGEQRWSKISTTTGWSNHLGHLWCCDFDDDGSPND